MFHRNKLKVICDGKITHDFYISLYFFTHAMHKKLIIIISNQDINMENMRYVINHKVVASDRDPDLASLFT